MEELREQLYKTSRNSSNPPSSDGPGKPAVKKDRSLREALKSTLTIRQMVKVLLPS
ncbi:MAG: DUF6444 domain-containing protein [Lachnospiraceae bacterium]|nr:DUF6444 domain-containing protein [Lachnospiraceae bacterium]